MRRAALVLAIGAALFGAPSALLAAPPNRLVSPSAVPTSGSVHTTFALSVRYVSAGGNPARRVVVDIGPLRSDLDLVSGTAVDGVWATEVLLPAGTWPVTFRASVSHGPQPTASGPMLTVMPAAGGVPSPGPSDASPPGGSTTPSPGGGPGTGDDPQQQEPAPQESAAPTTAPDGDPAPGPGRSADPRDRGDAPAATRPRATDPKDVVNGPRGEPAPGAGGIGSAPLDGGPQEPGIDDLLVLLGVVVGVTAFGLLATGWMLAGRSRDDEPHAAPARTAASEARRARRRSRAAGHDPVLAAMGLDDDPTDRPADR
jgi:hypothetical protein